MDTLSAITLILSIFVTALLVWVVVLLHRTQHRYSADRMETGLELFKADLIARQSESLHALRDSIDAANKIINDRLAEGTGSLDRRMAVLGDIENRLGELAVQTTSIEAIGKNIQLLSELLRPPKLRGQIGEMLLDNLLAQILPQPMYDIQHGFSDGTRTDAVVRLGKRLLPIDAKFPMETFERLCKQPDNPALQKDFSRSIRKQIDSIATKYIRPAENTTEFALMYIPAEAVYHQLLLAEHQEVFDYALKKRVIPSSPGHLFAFLASMSATYSEVALAREGLTEGSRRLVAGLSQLAEMAGRLAGYHERMEGSMRALTAGFERSRNELTDIRRQLEKVRDPFTEEKEVSENRSM